MFNEECCGYCIHHEQDNDGEWICTNDLSMYYCEITDYDFKCSDWEERNN